MDGKGYFWKPYAWVICTLYCFSLFWLNWHDLWEILRSAVDIICLVGLFGFTYHKAIGTRTLWRIWICLSISLEIWTFIAHLTPNGWELGLMIALTVPLYYGLTLYAFGSEALWKRSSSTELCDNNNATR